MMEEILKNISPRIDKKMNDYLTKKFTSQEIEEAINQMAPSKAPGPNGFPALFLPTLLGDCWPKHSLKLFGDTK